jgi:NADH:ubiquinone oxidoreductase subunit E
MNEWDKRIREHRVWVEMQSLGTVIDTASNVLPSMSPEEFAGLERLKAILAYGGKRLAAADPLVTLPHPLDQIANALAATRNELESFSADKDPAHVITANVAADGALPFFYALPGAYSPEELGALVSVATEYRAMVEQSVSSAKVKLQNSESSAVATLAEISAKAGERFAEFTVSSDSLQARLGDIAVSLQSEQQKLTQIVTDQQGQFSTAQAARSKEFTEGLGMATQQINKLATDYQSQFSTSQDSRSKEFATALSTQQTGYNAVIADYSKKLADQDADFTKQRIEFVQASKEDLGKLVNEYEVKAKDILEEVHERQKHVEKLVGVIGNLGVTSGYLRTANHAKYSMWFWQGMTVTAIITLTVIAYKTLGLLEDKSGHFIWGEFAARALILGSLGVLAAYSGSQADKLFADEKKNRKLALELEAIGPYLAPLPIEEQHKFRLQIGERSFGQDHDTELVTRKSPATLAHLLQSKEVRDFLELAMDLAKKSKGAP